MILPILHHPDARLRQKAVPVTRFDDELQKLIDDMFETMYAAPGIGLAATQVGVALRVAVLDVGEDADGRAPMVLVNPQIVERSEKVEVDEGCLSVPGVSDTIERYGKVRMKALDRKGAAFELEAQGLLAQAIQHEIDHLDGKLYIDYLSSLKRERIRKKLAQERR